NTSSRSRTENSSQFSEHHSLTSQAERATASGNLRATLAHDQTLVAKSSTAVGDRLRLRSDAISHRAVQNPGRKRRGTDGKRCVRRRKNDTPPARDHAHTRPTRRPSAKNDDPARTLDGPRPYGGKSTVKNKQKKYKYKLEERRKERVT
ncbi:unnamed protein product, partial [Ixodes pacificus]